MAKQDTKKQDEKQYDTERKVSPLVVGKEAAVNTNERGVLNMAERLMKKPKYYAEGGKTDFPDQSAEARKKRMEMPADQYGKMVDKTLGTSKGGKKGDFNEEPDTAKKTKKYAKGGSVSSASKRADGCITKGKTKGRMV